jgi:hypothetical protein
MATAAAAGQDDTCQGQKPLLKDNPSDNHNINNTKLQSQCMVLPLYAISVVIIVQERIISIHIHCHSGPTHVLYIHLFVHLK